TILILAVLTSFGCSVFGNQAKTSDKYKLPSGREIKITGMNQMQFANGQTGLVLNYQTEIPIENLDELKAEVAEVWTIFRIDVERAGVNSGIIRATHLESGGLFVQNGKGYGFVYLKNADGTWYMDESKK